MKINKKNKIINIFSYPEFFKNSEIKIIIFQIDGFFSMFLIRIDFSRDFHPLWDGLDIV